MSCSPDLGKDVMNDDKMKPKRHNEWSRSAD